MVLALDQYMKFRGESEPGIPDFRVLLITHLQSATQNCVVSLRLSTSCRLHGTWNLTSDEEEKNLSPLPTNEPNAARKSERISQVRSSKTST